MNLTTGQKIAILEEYGFTIGERDPRLNTDFPGSLMVTEANYDNLGDYELPTEDAANGPVCVVGDDLEALLDDMIDEASRYDGFEEIVERYETVADADLPARRFTSLSAPVGPKP